MMTLSPPRADVQALIDMGFTDVFPCKPDKSPRTGKDWRDTPPDGWSWRDDDLIGLPMPAQTAVIDLDHFDHTDDAVRAAVAAALPWLVVTVVQETRSGSMHLFYRTDGRDVEQMVRIPVAGDVTLDTRVGGKGYVIAWQPERMRPTDEWAMAPDEVYGLQSPRAERQVVTTDEPMTTDHEIVAWLGRRVARSLDAFTDAELTAMQEAALADGLIVATDPKRPWTRRDFERHNRAARKWKPGTAITDSPPLFSPVVTTAEPPKARTRTSVADLLRKDLPPTRYAVPGLLAEGLALLAAPPKSGKSFLCYQLAVELALGKGSILDLPVEKRSVLYYALEDGERRSQDRIRAFLQGRPVPDNLDLFWEAPLLGGPLEAEVSAYLDEHPLGVVIIDVLALVRPGGGPRNINAYDADYGTLRGLKGVAKSYPGSTILVVTHDRKAGSEDWMTQVTGTKGVTGAADTVIFIKRKRGEQLCDIYVSGRDIEDEHYEATFKGRWDPPTLMDTIHETKQAIVSAVAQAPGRILPVDVAKAIGHNRATVSNRMKEMLSDGILDADAAEGYGLSETWRDPSKRVPKSPIT